MNKQQLIFNEAVTENNLKVVNEYINKPDIDLTFDNNFLFRYVVANEFTEITELLLSRKEVNPADLGNSALYDAVNTNYNKIALKLLKIKEVKSSIKIQEIFMCAVCADNIEVVKLLLNDDRLKPNAQMNSAVIISSYNDLDDIADLLFSVKSVYETLEDIDPDVYHRLNERKLKNKNTII